MRRRIFGFRGLEGVGFPGLRVIISVVALAVEFWSL